MALLLDATVGGSTANAYADLVAADRYFERHLYAASWEALPPATKAQALVWATQLIDERVAFVGVPVSDTQALRCPRVGLRDRDGRPIPSTLIPIEVQRATIELARWLTLSDRTAESATAEYAALSIGPISVTMNPGGSVAVLPAVVAAMLTPYGIVTRSNRPSSATLLRV